MTDPRGADSVPGVSHSGSNFGWRALFVSAPERCSRSESGFPLDQISERNLQGTLGSGGNQLTHSPVNGNVTLRRGS